MLVYAKQPTSMRFPTASSNNRNGRSCVLWSCLVGRYIIGTIMFTFLAGGLRHWLSRHKLLSILLGYGLMLATIGFANNQPIHYYYKMLMKKLDIVYATVK